MTHALPRFISTAAAFGALLAGCAVDPGFMPAAETRSLNNPGPAVVVTPVVAATIASTQEVTCRAEAYRRSFEDPAARDLIYGQAYRDCMRR
ncbi:hypothetical protein FN976_15620 [Caenimonas sedimenti]|uniref:Uncharacterized protein n=2 Tax=Caenimonas sedimenti TaxID=2596921 RepID=A0A562ZQ01_9BURK|nr:hypothetical protein FN976_15620 [Caenimonas sedimenti]